MDKPLKDEKKKKDKAAKAALQKDSEEKAAAAQAAEQAALKILEHKKNTAMFLFDWKAIGHPATFGCRRQADRPNRHNDRRHKWYPGPPICQ